MKPIFAIKDRAVNNYGETLTMPSEQHAIRWFKDLVNAKGTQSLIANHPDDYDLYRIGAYEDEKGRILPLDTPELVARAKDLITPKE